MTKDNFNKSSRLFYFQIPFTADLNGAALGKLLERLEMTATRRDDCDSQAGFRLMGATGALRMFKQGDAWSLNGSALDSESRDQIKPLYDECLKAIEDAGGTVQKKSLVKPFSFLQHPPKP